MTVAGNGADNPVHQVFAAAFHGEAAAVLGVDQHLVSVYFAAGVGIYDGHAQGRERHDLAVFGGHGLDGHVSLGLDGDGVGLASTVAHGEVEIVTLLEILTGCKIEHHLQVGIGAGILVHMASAVDAGTAVTLCVGRTAQPHGRLGGHIHGFAVSCVCILHAVRILHRVGQHTAAAFIYEERAEADGVALDRHFRVQLGQILAHQTLGGLDVAGDALHIGNRHGGTLAVVYGGRGGVQIVGKGVVGGVVHFVGGRYVRPDQGHDAAGHGNGQRQRGGNGDHGALAQRPACFFLVSHGLSNLRQCVRGGVQRGKGFFK